MSIGYGPYANKGMSQGDRIEAMLVDLLKRKKPSKPRAAKTDGYGPAFTKVWGIYPKRVGGNPKRKAFSAYNQRIAEKKGSNAQWLMVQGTARYAAFCDATVEDKRFVMQAATFFGPDKHYENDWTVPTQTETVPKKDTELVDWAATKGYRGPHVGESYEEYRRTLNTLHRSE